MHGKAMFHVKHRELFISQFKGFGLGNPLHIFFWATSENDLDAHNFDQLETYSSSSLHKVVTILYWEGTKAVIDL